MNWHQPEELSGMLHAGPPRRVVFSPGPWVEWAACSDADPEIFFPISTTGPSLEYIGKAQEFCGRCPVADECLDWALSSGQDHGVWGGTTPEARRAMRRHQARSA